MTNWKWKKPHPTNSWPFSRLFCALKGSEAALKVSCAANAGSSKQIPPGVPVCHQQWERLNNTFLKDTCNGNTNPLFHSEQLSFLCRHLYMEHVFLEAQFPDNYYSVTNFSSSELFSASDQMLFLNLNPGKKIVLLVSGLNLWLVLFLHQSKILK